MKSKRRTMRIGWLFGILMAIGLCLALVQTGSASLPASFDNIFDLQGSPWDTNAAGTAPTDWNNIFPTYNPAAVPLPDAKSFVQEYPLTTATKDDIFTRGSKDINDYDNNFWTLSTAPDKVDMGNAYATAFTNPADGHLIVFFGADRIANEGDAYTGFWFFINKIGENPDGSFSGVHTPGDVLVLTDYTKGGTVAAVNVYKWVTSGGDVAPNLQLVATGADCSLAVPASPDVCAIVNADDIAASAPWKYIPKGGAEGDPIPARAFLEGGIDITDLVPEAVCLSSYIAETRSSASVTAELKDLVIGEFDLCSISLTKTPSTPDVCDGKPVTYTYVVTNDGSATVSTGTLTDDKLGAIGNFNGLLPGASKTFTGGPVNITGTVTNTATATATYTASITKTATATATVNGHVCTIGITKVPRVKDVCNDKPIIYDIVVTNNSDKFEWTGSVIDDVLGTLDASTVIAAGKTESYAPSHNTTGEVKNTVTADGTFNDGSATTAKASASATVNGHVCRITIVKNAIPNDLHDFQFNGTFPTFYLDDDEGVADKGIPPDIDQPVQKQFDVPSPTSVSVTERQDAFWKLNAPIDCTGPGSGDVTQITNGISTEVGFDDDIVCTFVNEKQGGPTRTPGFWKNHTTFTEMIFDTKLGGSMTIGIDPNKMTIDSYAKLFGVYFASNNKLSDNKTQRSDIDHARMLLAFQLVTAKLNVAAFGADSSIQKLISDGDAAFSGCNAGLMTSIAAQLDVFNNSGDTILLGYPAPGKATPKDSQALPDAGGKAGLKFWDILIPICPL